MKKLLISAGALSALVFTSAPAAAVPVAATSNANARARIVQPLTLTSVRDLDLGTIVLGTGTYTDTVGITRAGVFSCGANVTCSGTTQTAQYTATGTRDQVLTVIVPATLNLVNQTQAAADIILTVDAPGTVTLSNAGSVTFDIGGSIPVSDTTVDGVYQGTFNVQADYQ